MILFIVLVAVLAMVLGMIIGAAVIVKAINDAYEGKNDKE